MLLQIRKLILLKEIQLKVNHLAASGRGGSLAGIRKCESKLSRLAHCHRENKV